MTVPAISFDADGVDLATQAAPGDIEFDDVSFCYSSSDASTDAGLALCNVICVATSVDSGKRCRRRQP